MRPFFACILLLAIAPVLSFSQGAAAASDPVPRLDVKQSCRDAQAVSIEGERRHPDENPSGTYTACMQDETQAHDQLAQRWSKFKPASRQSCLAQGIRPSPSYVEILTCLEMNDETGVPTRSGMTPNATPAPVPASTAPRARGL